MTLYQNFYKTLSIFSKKKQEEKPKEDKTKDLEFKIEDLLKGVFDKMGAKPTIIAVPVLLQKGHKLDGLYTIPETREVYVDEQSARSKLQPGQTLYEVTIRRLE